MLNFTLRLKRSLSLPSPLNFLQKHEYQYIHDNSHDDRNPTCDRHDYCDG
ncbi:MAG: hypothetical protein J7545_15490 [Roseofilum sp. SBFL]|nr:hypothetical protein [Roseofilum sp. SBFL]MBP0043352.1 hypothetical protein [Roseofilum sp. SBFL]